MRPRLNLSLQRLLAIDDHIRSGRFPTQEGLAATLEVSRRTVQRDFDFLRDQGAPLRYDAIRRGFCYADPTYKLSFLKVSAQELLGIFLAQRLLTQYGDTPFGQGIASLFDRCLPMLSGEVRVEPEQLRACLGVRVAPVAHADASLFERVSKSVLEHQQIKVVYWTAERGVMSQRVIDPYALVCVHGDWHVIGHCHLRRAVRTFAVHRIHHVEDTKQMVEPPPDFDLDSYLSEAFAKVRGEGAPQTIQLRFLPEAARYVRERRWHPTQEIEELPAGELRLTLRLASLLEVKAWALSWGARCVVEEPEELRREICEELKRARLQYGEDGC